MDKFNKLMVLLILFLCSTVAWEGYQVLAIPAPTINSVCEPGSCSSSPCNYYIYQDQVWTSSAVTLAKNCQTGTNDFSNSNATIVINAVFSAIAALPAVAPVPPGLLPSGPNFKIVFASGNFYVCTIIINVPSAVPNTTVGIYGAGRNKTNLISNSGCGDMFNIQSAGNIFEVRDIKLEGTQAVAPSQGFDFINGVKEIDMFHTEIRDFPSNSLLLAGANGGTYNVFQDVWFIGSSGAIRITGTGYTDFRITGCHFELAAFITAAAGVANVVMTGNIFDNSQIAINNGGVTRMVISGNDFINSKNPEIQFLSTGLAALTNMQTIISGNMFRAETGTFVAISLGDFVDGVTVTANTFSGYTSSSTVPVTLTQTHQKLTTLVTQNSGMGASWTGFGIAQPAVAASTVNVQNTNPYQVRIYITATGSGITAYKVTDPSGTSNTFTTAVTIGYTIELDPYAQVALTYTGTPTWLWYGEANLA